MHTLELKDIQGYIIRAYGHMNYSRFSILKVEDSQKAKLWIKSILGEVTHAGVVKKENLPDTSLNIAFAKEGLKALGLADSNIAAFSPPFKEGMVTPHRKRLLGDIDSSDPDQWLWGNDNSVEILLLVFGKDLGICLSYHEKLTKDIESKGLKIIRNMDGATLKDGKEHFGFKDGNAQPIIKGSGKKGPEYDMVNPGEFILGYKNNYEVYPDSPALEKLQGNINLLPAHPSKKGMKDLGRNGSYLIIRQMQQHVDRFWSFMEDKTKSEDGTTNQDETIKLASKMIGRWPSGAPISKFPNKDPGGVSDENDFLYADEDPKGIKCPYGSHLRRMNPRDSFEQDSKKRSLILSNRHRIIRRARLYGEPIIGSPLDHKPKDEVGLYFNCFSADISRQFEFLQYTWSNYPKIKELYNDPDPIIGVVENPKEGQQQQFTLQGETYNKTIKDLKRFVTIKGGTYFFFPSITTIRFLCSLD